MFNSMQIIYISKQNINISHELRLKQIGMHFQNHFYTLVFYPKFKIHVYSYIITNQMPRKITFTFTMLTNIFQV